MKILVAGLGKSGTTVLYSRIKNTRPDLVPCRFEPRVQDLTGDEGLIKTLVCESRPDCDLFNHGVYDSFEKRVFIVRDPRDRLISGLLYHAATARFDDRFGGDPDSKEEFMKRLKQKEEDPRSVSLAELSKHITYNKNGKPYATDMIECTIKYDHYLVKYEDFVKDDVAGLEEYLGFELTGSNDVGIFTRVIRSKRAGNWRNWFTPADVELCSPVFTPFMRFFGYDTEDWELATEPVIEPELSTEYIERTWHGWINNHENRHD